MRANVTTAVAVSALVCKFGHVWASFIGLRFERFTQVVTLALALRHACFLHCARALFVAHSSDCA